MLPEDKIEEILNGIFEGTINVANLPEDLYLATAKYLEGGLYKGYGAKLDACMYYQPDYELLSELRDNVYIFSGAKTYQQVRDMSGLIAKTKTFSEFQREARKVYDEYNKNWLKAEYQTTIGQGQMANLWNQIEQTKDIFPYLEYKAVIDSKTSEICRPLDGVILKVDDPFWNKYTPLNHFNCRCTVKKLDKYTDKLTTNPSRLKEIEGEVSGQVPDEFKMNVGKDGYVFNPKEHPYFKVAPKDKGLAKNNFGLPIPEPPAPNQAVSKPKENNYDFTNMSKKEMESSVSEMFAKKGINANVDLQTLPPKKRVQYMDKLQELMNDYDIPPPSSSKIDILFKQEDNAFGTVTYVYNGNQYVIDRINFGNITDVGARSFVEGGEMLRAKSKADPDKAVTATLVHEFAHLFSIEERKLSTERERLFWGRLSQIKMDYKAELRNISDPKEKYKLHLGNYASTKTNEFMAEGFAEYKNSANPSKYAQKVGELIDEFFKKK